MNKKGTIVRVILAIASVLNETAVISGIADFNSPELTKIYHIVSFIFMVAMLFINTYYNQDFTVEGAEGTNFTRQLKAMKKENRRGEEGEDNE